MKELFEKLNYKLEGVGLKKSYLYLFIIIELLFLVTNTSYALFTTRAEKENVATIKGLTIDVRLNIIKEYENGILLNPNETKVVNVELNNLSSVELKYSLVLYTKTDKIKVSMKSLSDTSNNPTGFIKSKEIKNVSVVLKNDENYAQTIYIKGEYKTKSSSFSELLENEYRYTGKEKTLASYKKTDFNQKFVAPISGYYLIEARRKSDDSINNYIKGYIYLEKESKLTLNINDELSVKKDNYLLMKNSSDSNYISGYAGYSLSESKKYFINPSISSEEVLENSIDISYEGVKKPTIATTKPMRYIMDCSTENTIDNSYRLKQIIAISNGENVAFNKSVKTYTLEDNNLIPFVSNTNNDLYIEILEENKNKCTLVDLGKTYEVDQVLIYHYINDNEIYLNNKTYSSSKNEVSSLEDFDLIIDKLSLNENYGKRYNAYQTVSDGYVQEDLEVLAVNNSLILNKKLIINPKSLTMESYINEKTNIKNILNVGNYYFNLDNLTLKSGLKDNFLITGNKINKKAYLASVITKNQIKIYTNELENSKNITNNFDENLSITKNLDKSIYSLRVYSRELKKEEILSNKAYDEFLFKNK